MFDWLTKLFGKAAPVPEPMHLPMSAQPIRTNPSIEARIDRHKQRILRLEQAIKQSRGPRRDRYEQELKRRKDQLRAAGVKV